MRKSMGMPRRSDTKARMVGSAAALLRENGVAGTGFRDVVEHSGTPRGSIGHHFPGGKRQMLVEAVRLSGGRAAGLMRQADEIGPTGALHSIADHFRQSLVESDFKAVCTVGAVAMEGWREEELRAAAAAVFDEWRAIMRQQMVAGGAEPEHAANVADLAIAAVEGALLMCRVDRSTAALDHVERLLGPMLEAATHDDARRG